GRGVFDALYLSEDQQAQIQEILKSHRDRTRSQYQGNGERLSFEDRKAKRAELQNEIQKQVRQVLTAEQSAKADDLKAQLERGEMPDEIIDARVERFSAALNLTDDQKARIKTLERKRFLGRTYSETDRRAFRRKMKERRQEHHMELFSILTPEQQGLLTQMAEGRQNQARQRFGHLRETRSSRRLDYLAAELNLSESQKGKLREIFTSLYAETRGELDRTNRRTDWEKMRERLGELDKQIEEILTAEQVQKYNELKAVKLERKGRQFRQKFGKIDTR
ncbi:hypothetical protein MJD09_04140, partial [bacterium]|nr:hypothetical protein [bacterium]